MTHEQLILERDYYYKRQITSSDKFRFAVVAIAAHLVVYWYMLWTPMLKAAFDGSALYVLSEALVSLPVAAVVPYLIVRRYLASIVPKLFSLADEAATCGRKAIRLIASCEIFRFLMGILPVSLTRFGVITSPITYLLYTLLYVNPTGKYDVIMVQNEMSAVDMAVFFLIYIVYFAVYETVIVRKIKKEVLNHHKYLEGCLCERIKYS